MDMDVNTLTLTAFSPYIHAFILYPVSWSTEQKQQKRFGTTVQIVTDWTIIVIVFNKHLIVYESKKMHNLLMYSDIAIFFFPRHIAL